MNVRLIAVTKPEPDILPVGAPTTAEELIVYVARVSNPENQGNLETGAALLRYCIRKKHWSVFEQCDLTVEIITSRAISAQILRHRSFSFQEFSQRYAEAVGFEGYYPRRQDKKNRQNSTDDLSEETKHWFWDTQGEVYMTAMQNYREAIQMGIAKECARFLLPMATQTTLYMKGSCRSWIHYIQLRTDQATQLEHREVAEAVKVIFMQQFPVISEALEWTK